jgi:hypothetical protein
MTLVDVAQKTSLCGFSANDNALLIHFLVHFTKALATERTIEIADRNLCASKERKGRGEKSFSYNWVKYFNKILSCEHLHKRTAQSVLKLGLPVLKVSSSLVCQS